MTWKRALYLGRRLQFRVQPRLLEQHLAQMPTPAWLAQRDRRSRLRIEVAAAEPGFAVADLDEALALPIETLSRASPRDRMGDVLGHDLGFAVRENASLGYSPIRTSMPLRSRRVSGLLIDSA